MTANRVLFHSGHPSGHDLNKPVTGRKGTLTSRLLKLSRGARWTSALQLCGLANPHSAEVIRFYPSTPFALLFEYGC
jgi:hypothetical protein